MYKESVTTETVEVNKESVTSKIFEIQKEMLTLEKDAKNPFYKSKYVTLDKIVSALQPLWNKFDLVVFHYCKDNHVHTVVANQGEKYVDGMAGDRIVSSFPLPNTDPQKVGSAITYGKRYNLGCLFNIITERDDDAQSLYNDKGQPDIKIGSHGGPAFPDE